MTGCCCSSVSSVTTSKIIPPPEPAIPKATSRSQLEAARARFFAELMQTSDLFKDTPAKPLSLSTDSLNVDTASTSTSTDPFSKQTTKSTAATTNHNNNSLPSAISLANSNNVSPQTEA